MKKKSYVTITDLPEVLAPVLVLEEGCVLFNAENSPIIWINVALSALPEQTVSRSVHLDDEIGFIKDDGNEVGWTVGTAPLETLALWAIKQTQAYLAHELKQSHHQTRH